MATFEDSENSLNCFYDSDVNSVISDSDYDLDEDIEVTDSTMKTTLVLLVN